MKRKTCTRDDVERGLALLKAEGKEPTIANLRTAVGGGSFTTLIALKNQIEGERTPQPPDTEPQRKLFDGVWNAAYARGKAEGDAGLFEANGTITELIAENQRLETEMSAILARFERVERQRDEMLAQVGSANEATIQARAAGEQYAAKLSKALTRITVMQDAQGKAMEQLRRKVDLAEMKAHGLELALTRAETKLEERSG